MSSQEVHMDERTLPLGRLQKLVGHRMSWSKQNIPCFYLQRKADISELLDMRRGAGKERSVKITTNDFLVKAMGLAAERFPLLAGWIHDDDIVIAETVNVGFAVAAPHGLVIPVIRDAQKKNIAQIAVESAELTQKARSNLLHADDVTGSCLMLSNLGVYGIDSFIAVPSPRRASVLAVGNILKIPVSDMETRRYMDLTLSVDHRVVNGDYAAIFLSAVADLLEHPQKLL